MFSLTYLDSLKILGCLLQFKIKLKMLLGLLFCLASNLIYFSQCCWRFTIPSKFIQFTCVFAWIMFNCFSSPDLFLLQEMAITKFHRRKSCFYLFYTNPQHVAEIWLSLFFKLSYSWDDESINWLVNQQNNNWHLFWQPINHWSYFFSKNAKHSPVLLT